MPVSRLEIFGAASRAVWSSMAAAAAAQTAVGTGAPSVLPLSSPFGFSTRNIGTTSSPRCSAVATSCQSLARDPIGDRRHLLRLQSGRQGAGELPAGRVGQQRVARRRHRQAWGRRLREQPGGGAGIAEERLRQVAARREQQQDKQAEA